MRHFLVVATAAFLTLSCGLSQSNPQPQPAPAPDKAFDAVKAIIAVDCGPCHNGSVQPAFTSGAVFKSLGAQAKLEAGLMPPPPKGISPEDKASLLGYLAL